MSEYAIEIVNLTKRFGNFTANDKINLKIKQNEIHSILGENGAGKSTLMNMIFGILHPDEGCIKINGQEVDIKNPLIAKQYGIGMVHQHFKLVKPFTITENIILGEEPKKGIVINRKEATKKIQAISDKYGFGLNPNAKIKDLTVGQQQKVEILKMLYKEAQILIFDEPTGALVPSEILELLEIIRNLKKQGKTVILITHKLDEIRAVGDTCSVIRRGKYIGSIDIKDVNEDELAEMMVGRKVNLKVEKKAAQVGEVILDVQNLAIKSSFGEDSVKGISLDVKKGEILGIAGVDGNGQIEFVEGITGLKKVKSGKIIFNNIDITKKSVRKKTAAGIGHIPQDRQKFGLVLDFTIAENVGLQEYYHKPFSSKGIMHKKAFREYGDQLIESYDIRTNSGVYSKASELSGGNQQKVIIAREINRNPDLLIAVQPTRGLDVGAIEYIHRKIIEQRDNGKGVLLVSLELDEIMKLSDRIAVFFDGMLMGIVDAATTDEKEIGLMMAGKKKG